MFAVRQCLRRPFPSLHPGLPDKTSYGFIFTHIRLCSSAGRWLPARSAPNTSARWPAFPSSGWTHLSSAAYGPEAALTLLIPLGLMGVHYIVPVSAAIVVLLFIVFFSYRQTIDAYPQGGGSYTVASQNLGEGAGLLAAAALMIDYTLTAAVGISAGVGALISAVPSLQPHTLELCLWCWRF